jgi:hypothetical protein
MKTTNEQRRQWAANALALAEGLPDSADHDMLLQIAKEHLRAIARKENRSVPPPSACSANDLARV